MTKESCTTSFTADSRLASTLTFQDIETLGRVTILMEGDCIHVLEHLGELVVRFIEETARILGDDI